MAIAAAGAPTSSSSSSSHTTNTRGSLDAAVQEIKQIGVLVQETLKVLTFFSHEQTLWS